MWCRCVGSVLCNEGVSSSVLSSTGASAVWCLMQVYRVLWCTGDTDVSGSDTGLSSSGTGVSGNDADDTGASGCVVCR